MARRTSSRDLIGRSSLEATFDYYWRALAQNQEEPVSQFRFNRWVIDRAFPDCKLAIELNGGSGGGYGQPVVCHQCGTRVKAKKRDGSIGRELRLPYPSHSGQGSERDARKINDLQEAGWTVLVFTSAQIESDPVGCIAQITRFLKRCEEDGIGIEAKIQAEALQGERLTQREVEVLREIAGGKTTRAVAFQLGISINTVEVHVRHIREKFGCSTITSAVAIAVQSGMIEVDVSGAQFADRQI